MEILPSTYYETLKRLWRRRRYQRLNASTNKRKLKVMRLGGPTATRWLWKIRKLPKLRLKYVSPFKILAKFHDAYVEFMIRLAGSVDSSNNLCVFGGKRVPKGRQVSMMSCSSEEVDRRLVLEIYKRLAASGELCAF